MQLITLSENIECDWVDLVKNSCYLRIHLIALLFSSCLYISERFHKCKLNMTHSYQVPSYVNVCAYVHRILQKKYLVFVGILNVTYEYILNIVFK